MKGGKNVKRRINLSESETEEEFDKKHLCDDIEPLNCDVCLVYNDFRQDKEMWYRCVGCGNMKNAVDGFRKKITYVIPSLRNTSRPNLKKIL